MWLFVIILLGGIYQSISYFKQYLCKTVLLSSVIKIDVERSFVCAYSYIKQINICHVFVQNLDIGHVYIYSQIKQGSQKPSAMSEKKTRLRHNTGNQFIYIDIVQSSMGLHMHGDQTQRNFTLLKHRKISSLKPFTEMTNKLGTKRTVCQIFFCKVYKSYCFWTFITILRLRITRQLIIV